MPHSTDGAQASNGALQCLALASRLHDLPVDAETLRHQIGLGAQEPAEQDLLRAARRIGFRARAIDLTWGQLCQAPLPMVSRQRDGRFVVVVRLVEGDRLLIHDPLEPRPLVLPRQVFEPAWSGRVVLLKRRIKSGSQARFGFGWFVPSLIKYRRLLGEVLVASFFVQLFALVTPLFFQVVIDKVLAHRGMTTLDVLAIGLLGVSLFEVVLGGLRAYVLSHTTSRVDVELGAKLFRHLLALPLAYFRSRRVGDSVARVRELDSIRNFITGSALTVLIDLSFTTVFLAVLFYYSPTLSWVVIGTIPAYVLLSALVTPVLRARLNEKFARGAENQAFLVESVTGVETLKSLAVEPQMERRWEEQLAAHVSASFRASNLSNMAGQVAGFINKVMVVLILWIGARLVMEGQLTVGQLIAFNMLAARVSGPVLRLVQLWQDFQQADISIRRLADILNTPSEQGVRLAGTRLPRIEGRVTFEHVNFRFRPDGPEVLTGLNLELGPGQLIGVVGRSGSGKSTLTKLIQRLYTPESGRVLVDGADIGLLDAAWLRRQIGVVLQDNVLFNRSVRENIALADPGLPMDRVIRAARLAGAHDFIVKLPEGYDTVVGEQGATLSGGQRQRIAIARALITNPRILILDEATSALDYESEEILERNMSAIRRGRTVIIIAHRLSTVRKADRIVVMERGRIIEQGSQVDLLERHGFYARMHAHQTGVVASRASDGQEQSG